MEVLTNTQKDRHTEAHLGDLLDSAPLLLRKNRTKKRVGKEAKEDEEEEGDKEEWKTRKTRKEWKTEKGEGGGGEENFHKKIASDVWGQLDLSLKH